MNWIDTVRDILFRRANKRAKTLAEPGEFLTEDQICLDITQKMSDDAWAILRDTPEDQLIRYHMTAGRAIRNEYGLWLPGNPLTASEHADDVSMRIIQRIWRTARAVADAKAQTA